MSTSTGRPNTSSRSSSRTRPLPPLTNSSASVAALIGPTQACSMNVTINPNRTRLINGVRPPSADTRTVATQNIPPTSSSNQHKTSNEPIKLTVSSQERTTLVTNQRHTNGASNDTSDEYRNRYGSSGVSSISKTTTSDESAKAKSASADQVSSQSLSALEQRLRTGGLNGLQNLGNTCFMNSVLQCLSNTKPLLLFCFKDNLSEYLNKSSTSSMKGILMQEYANLIRRMWNSSETHSIVSPSSFKNTVGRFAPRFLGFSQQDSQEFLRYLLQGLHEDVNRVQRKPTPEKIDEKAEERMPEIDRAMRSWGHCLLYDNSPISDIFAGQLKSTLECCHCHYRSITFDMFWDLSIPLPRNKSSCTLLECLQLFMSKEDLDGNEKPMCAQCKQKRRCTKKFSIQKCPEILVLHLKRFSQARGRTKLSSHVDFPLTELRLGDLSEAMSESYDGPVPTYKLFGVSYHSGTAYSGHYTAQCKHPFTNQWHEFNDSSVYAINDPSRIISSNAYVLFYERNK